MKALDSMLAPIHRRKCQCGDYFDPIRLCRCWRKALEEALQRGLDEEAAKEKMAAA